jgi:4-carboxymuconolactone decarboxylase
MISACRAKVNGMTDAREKGIQVFRELLRGAVPDGEVNFRDGKFGDELLEIGIDNVFGRLWGREGLSRRDRSLVTLGILIALRATDELKSHLQIARNNGLTEDEIAEVIYHSSGYAGFPAANAACKVAREVFDPEQ